MMKYLVMVLLLSFFGFVHCNAQTVPSAVDSVLLDSLVKSNQERAILKDRLEKIEFKGQVYDKFFDKLEGMTSSFSTHLTFLSVFLAIISSVMLIFQILASRRDNKVMEEMRESYLRSMSAQDSNNEKLLSYVTTNIDKTSKFIETYESLIAIRDSSQKFNERIKLMEEREKELLKSSIERQRDINSKAVRLMESVFKAQYSSSFFTNSDLRNFDNFYIRANAPFNRYKEK